SEGTYRYEVQVRIDDEDAKTHVLSGNNDVTVMVNGERWETIQDVRAGGGDDGYSYMVVASKEFNVTAPENLALTFHDSSVFDIGKSFKGHEIQSYFVAQNAEGGTKPYTFSKVSGPAWISVSAAGEISGTPDAVGENEDLVVQVTDSKDAEATITIKVAETVLSSSDREKIYTFEAKSLTGDITPEYGSSGAEDPKFTVIEGQPAYLSDTMGYYIKKVGDDWIDINVNDTIDEGTYRYKVQLRIDGDKGGEEYVLPQAVITVTVDGEEWEVVYPVATVDKTSWVWVMSPEFTVTKPVIQAIKINGITAPVAGETADVSGITTANKGITLGEVQWCKPGRDSKIPMGESDKFELGKTYYLVIPYTVSEDYTVSESAEVLHDLTGGIAKHDSSAKTIVIEYTVPETYTVTVTTDGNGTAEASVARAAKGTTVTLTATPNEGYEFDKWEVTPPRGVIVLVTDNSFVMPAGAVTVKAIFKEKAVTPATYTVKFYANYGSGEMNPVTVTAGEYTLPECGFTAPEGQRFKAWRINGGDEYAAGETITISQDSYAVAQWEPIPNPILNTINIKGITAPVAGETAVTTGITTDTEGIAVKTVQWLTDASIVMTSQKFEAGETYYLFIRFETDIYHKVSDRAAFIHDLTNGTLNHIDNTDATSPWIKIEYTVPGGTPKTPVESVKISDVTKPVIGATPDFNITLTGEGAAFDEEEGNYWYKYTGDWEELDEATPFGPGTYVLDIYLKAEDGYKFTKDTKYFFSEDELPDYEDVDFGVSCYYNYGDYVTLEIFFVVEGSDTPEHTCTWGATTYEWAEDGSSCTAERVCITDSTHKETAAATITSAEKTPASETEKGWTTYTATFAKDWAATQTKDIQDIPVLTHEHTWGATTYEWAEDGSSCKAERVCSTDSTHKETAAATITSAEKTPASETEKGWTTYTATFAKDWAATQTKDVQDIPELTHEHAYATEWTSDKTNHWHASTCGHNVIADKEAHVYDNSKDAECNVCKYTRTVYTGSSTGGFSGVYNYPVVVLDNDDAVVSSSEDYAVKGEEVVITVTPDVGKAVDEVIVTDKDGKVIPVTRTGDNEYTFTMPASKVTVAVAMEDADYGLRIVMQINNKNILVNGVTKVNDVAPVIVDDRTLVPVRVVTELLGGTAAWDNETRTVTLKIDGKTMNMTIGKEIPGFGTSAVIMNDRTYVPVRYVMEMLGAEVEWIDATRQIIIEK
ncbi:MAG: copper amine oxidase N-terminal domain-containing protein, partial [Lachnospira sp.]|nr:copper amine oxidase N-terminal domain-containing protein [Lachnospira sp.]